MIKIGGIKISEGTTLEQYNQLQDGVHSLGINNISEGMHWFGNLSLHDKYELFKITDGYNIHEVLDVLTFGLF